MWSVWTDLSSELECNVPFDPMATLTSDPKTNTVLMNNIKSGLPYMINDSKIQKVAIVESKHFSSHYDVRNHIIGSGNGINISFNIVSSALGWIRSKGV